LNNYKDHQQKRRKIQIYQIPLCKLQKRNSKRRNKQNWLKKSKFCCYLCSTSTRTKKTSLKHRKNWFNHLKNSQVRNHPRKASSKTMKI
jgi:hypothetical protein